MRKGEKKMMNKTFLLTAIRELEGDILEAKKRGYVTDGLEKMKKEYLAELDKLGKVCDEEEAQKLLHEKEIEVANYIATMWD